MAGGINLFLVLLMFSALIHNSFMHDLPFYYILYGIAGLIIGHFVALTQKVAINKGTNCALAHKPPITCFELMNIVRFGPDIVFVESNKQSTPKEQKKM